MKNTSNKSMPANQFAKTLHITKNTTGLFSRKIIQALDPGLQHPLKDYVEMEEGFY